MSCSAKLPIYGFFVSVFFTQYRGLIFTGLYLLGIIVGILIAMLYKRTIFKGEAVPFVMELPNYRLPGAMNVLKLLWDKAKDFLQRAFTVIFISTIVIWFLKNFDYQLNMVENTGDSILAMISGWIAPLFAPVGMNDWRIVTSLITGFLAKESVVSTMGIVYGDSLLASMTGLTAASMLIFSLLYTPCVAAVVSIRRELGWKWSSGIVIGQCLVAYAVSGIVALIGLLL